MSSSVEQSGDKVLLECCRWWLAEAGVPVSIRCRAESRSRGPGLDWGECVKTRPRQLQLLINIRGNEQLRSCCFHCWREE